MNRHWRRIWLIGLLIALLPLRGWAWATMPVAAWEPPPCHASAHQADAQDAASDSHATCTLCDLCHAGVIVPPSWAWFHDAPPISPPSWAVSATHGRDGTDGLFRPPRA